MAVFLSFNWLEDWFSTKKSVQQVADCFTEAGIEVEEIHEPVVLPKVLVGQIIKVSKHPDADKLNVCEVTVGGNDSLTIVCGCSSVRDNLFVAVAMVGSVLPGGMTIKQAKLRGVMSSGMLCSASELGLQATSQGILHLDESCQIGDRVDHYLGLDDVRFEIGLTPNRGDCFSTLGLARELAALEACVYKWPFKPNNKLTGVNETKAKVKINANEACSQYVSVSMQGIDSQAKIPGWMEKRLRSAGLRNIHPVVDVCNYVMFELGQPMHAFDKLKVKGSIRVARITKEQPFEALTEDQLTLKKNMLVIEDDEKVLALAGVVGGHSSSVTTETQEIILESAAFSAKTIAFASQNVGLSTDSSMRFERGVDPGLPIIAMNRAISLIEEICHGKVVTQQVCMGEEIKPITIVLPIAKVESVLGIPVSEKKITNLLTQLSFVVTKHGIDCLACQVPSYRSDVRLPIDLVEEVSRMIGLDAIGHEQMIWQGHIQTDCQNQRPFSRAYQSLVQRGYREIITYSFVDDLMQQKMHPDITPVAVANPMVATMNVMRVSLLTSLLNTASEWQRRQHERIRLFEVGNVFSRQGNSTSERRLCSGLLSGSKYPLQWGQKDKEIDFYDAKEDVLSIVSSQIKHQITFIESDHHFLHPGKSANLILNGQEVGFVGVLHPHIQKQFKLKRQVVIFSCEEMLLDSTNKIRYEAVSRQPCVRRDIAFMISKKITFEQISNNIKKNNIKHLKSHIVFDIFDSDLVKSDEMHSMALAFVFQDDAFTLVDEQVNGYISSILASLKQQFLIKVR
jgi:phenylalanyl-tRNA synthetase beta chain